MIGLIILTTDEIKVAKKIVNVRKYNKLPTKKTVTKANPTEFPAQDEHLGSPNPGD